MKNLKIYKLVQILIWIIWAWVLTFVAWQGLDTDWGWHLRTGEIILKSGIPKTDPFSYTMPSFPYIDHAWMTDVIWARLYPVAGLQGIAVIWAVLTVVTVAWLAGKKNWQWAEIPAGLTFLILLPAFRIRTQIVDWWLWGILWIVIRQKELWKKWRWGAPLLIGLWVNLHGGFITGLGLLTGAVGLRTVQNKKIEAEDWTVVILSWIITTANPYGINLWREVAMTLGSSGLKENITEWKPYMGNMFMEFALLTGLVILIMSRYWKKISLLEKIIIIGLGAASMYIRRYTQFFALSALPLVAEGIGWMKTEIETDREKYRRGKIFYGLIGVVVGMYIVGTVIWQINGLAGKDKYGFPEQAVEWIKTKNLPGAIFSNYEWGGYLIWKLPEEKVFIDGRMAIWTQNQMSAMNEYLEIVKQGNVKPYFNKYGIKTVIWPTEKEIPEMGKRLREALGENKDKKFIETLKYEGFSEIYRDKTAVIYQKFL